MKKAAWRVGAGRARTPMVKVNDVIKDSERAYTLRNIRCVVLAITNRVQVL